MEPNEILVKESPSPISKKTSFPLAEELSLGIGGQQRGSSYLGSDMIFIEVLQGSLSYVVDGRSYNVNENEGLFINSQVPSFPFSKKKRLCRYLFFAVPYQKDYGLGLLENFAERGPSALLLRNDLPYQRDTLRCLSDAVEICDSKRPLYELQLLSIFYRMAYLLFPHFHLRNKASMSPSKTLFIKLSSYIQDHYFENLTLLSLSGLFKTSTRNINRLFTHYLDVSPVSYLISIRLQKGRELLVDSSYQIKEIANRVGYPSASHFVAAFQKEYALTPLKYRKKHTILEKPGTSL